MRGSDKFCYSIFAVLFFVSLLACRLPLIQSPAPSTPTVAFSPVPSRTAIPKTPLLRPTITPAQRTGTPRATPTPVKVATEDSERHQRIFHQVWRTVNRHYVYPSFNGTDWDAVRYEFEPLVESAPDDEVFWQLMQEMVDRLQDDHSAYLTPDEVIEEDQALGGNLDYVGIGVYVTLPEDTDYAVVLFPMPESPAESAGVLAHDRILEIDGLQVCCDEEGNDNLDTMLGPEGSLVNLLLQQPGESGRLISVVRARIQTQLPLPTRTFTSTVDGAHIGYLLIPTLWDETIAERTRDVLRVLLEDSAVSGLVVDMRINNGGAYTELYDLLSLFTQGEVGAFIQRDRTVDVLDILPDPVANSQDIPMIVLVGRETESYAEVFSGVLQAQGRATLVGEATAGNVETVYPYDFEDGSRLWLAEETFVVHGLPTWENAGVQPDIIIPGSWEDFTEKDDPALEAAVALLTGED